MSRRWQPTPAVTLDLQADPNARKVIAQYAKLIEVEQSQLARQLLASVEYFGGASEPQGDGMGARPRGT